MGKKDDFPHVAEAMDYARAVVRGDVLACKWIIAACQRQLDDLKRWKGKSGPYWFDDSAAERVIRFIELVPHVKGEWAKRRETLKLEPWQKFIWSTVFGWKRSSDGNRRFRETYLEIPRKNGKSAQVAPVGLFMFVQDGESGAEIYSGASSEKQAWEVFGPARLMAQKAQGFADHYGVQVNARNMNVLAEASKFEPVIGDPGDGASPHCAIVDEYHEHKSPRLYDTMLTGMGARSQPLMVVITTAGSNLGGPCYDMRIRAQKVLDGVFDDEELFTAIYTIDDDDDWTSEEALIKANPNFGVSVSADFLKAQQRKAIQNPSKQNSFKTKHLNVWCNASTAWMNMVDWDRCKDESLNIEDFAGERCWIGLDLASKIDIAAKVRLFLRDGIYYAFLSSYLPRDAVTAASNSDIYEGWEAEGLLTVTPGAMTDYTVIEDGIREDARMFDVIEIPYDPYNATHLAGRLLEDGLPLVEFGATVAHYSDPMKSIEALVRDGKLKHDGNPIMTWMMSNVVAHVDAKDNIFPRKERVENKIDGVIGLINALARAMAVNTEEGPSIYENREIVLL